MKPTLLYIFFINLGNSYANSIYDEVCALFRCAVMLLDLCTEPRNVFGIIVPIIWYNDCMRRSVLL